MRTHIFRALLRRTTAAAEQSKRRQTTQQLVQITTPLTGFTTFSNYTV